MDDEGCGDGLGLIVGTVDVQTACRQETAEGDSVDEEHVCCEVMD